MIVLRIVLFVIGFYACLSSAKTYTLEYGNNKTCIVHLNQAIDSVEYKESDNTKVDIDTKKYKTLKINFKNTQQVTKMTINAGHSRHKIIYQYNNAFNKPCSLFIKQQKKSRIRLDQINTETSFTQASHKQSQIKLNQLKYFNRHLVLELDIKNQKNTDIQNIDFEIATFKRKGFFLLKTVDIQYFRDFKTNCIKVPAKKSAACHVIIKNFYKKGYGLKLKVYLNNKKKSPLELYHKFIQ